jgi:hypothetical protein
MADFSHQAESPTPGVVVALLGQYYAVISLHAAEGV